MSSQLSQCQLSLPPEPALDHDDSVFWWDDYVNDFPSNFYTLISPEDFAELISDLEDDALGLDEFATNYAMDEDGYTTDEDGHATDEIAAATDKYINLTEFSYPIADLKRDIAEHYGMLDPDEKDAKGIPLRCRAVFIIRPDKKLKLSLLYSATTGRNCDEILRIVDSRHLIATKEKATPVDWKQESRMSPTMNVSKKDKEREKKRPPPNYSCGLPKIQENFKEKG